jgi:hypothetical protein
LDIADSGRSAPGIRLLKQNEKGGPKPPPGYLRPTASALRILLPALTRLLLATLLPTLTRLLLLLTRLGLAGAPLLATLLATLVLLATTLILIHVAVSTLR